jgi:chloramphenicol-sensitive protein RarD
MLRTDNPTPDVAIETPDKASATRICVAGLLAGLTAFVVWGVLPIYFKALGTVPATEVVAHRVLGTAALLAVLLLVPSRRLAARHSLRRPKVVRRLLASAALLAAQWVVFIWAMTTGQLMQASLAGFVSPVVTVLLGSIYLKERLRPGHWVMVLLTFAGVASLSALFGQVPGLALLLAVSYSGYGLLKKVTPVDGMTGLLAETALLSPLALAWLLWQGVHGAMVFGVDPAATVLLLFAGLVTAIPFYFFAAAAKRLQMSTLGVLQFITPTVIFLLGT